MLCVMYAVFLFFSLLVAGSASVKVGPNNCPILSHTNFVIVCTLPAGAGTSQDIVVTTSALLVSNSWTFNYDPPELFGYLWWSNRTGPPAGGNIIYMYGSSLGPAPEVSVDSRPCELIKANSTYIECRVPPGTGVNKPVLVTAGAFLTASYPYSYWPPVIYYISPTGGPTAGGTVVSVHGIHFGFQLGTIATAGTLRVPTFQNDTLLVYTTPARTGLQFVNALVDSQASNGVQYQYDYAIIMGVTPATGRTDAGSPTTVLTITGEGFSTSGYVTVGNAQATLTGVGYTDTRIEVLLPVGQGSAPVIVVTNNVPSVAWPWSYIPPNITRVNPTSSSTDGNILLTLTGTNFGQSGTVMIGSGTCTLLTPGTSWAFGQIVCLLPPGQGANLPVVLTVGGQVPVVTPTFSYLPPAINQVSPQSGPTQGGQTVTLFGVNFGLSAIISFVSPSSGPYCTLTGLGQSHRQIVCIVPAGEGLNVPIQVNVSGQISPSIAANQYNYDAPVITAISPLTAPTSGGSQVTLTGTSFGLGLSWLLTLGGVSLTQSSIVYWNHTRIIFTAPRGTGKDKVIDLRVASQPATYTGALFAYAKPIISKVSGCPTNTATATLECDITGGTTITIEGNNFGDTASKIGVVIGENLATCTSITIVTIDTVIRCTLGANPYGGFNLGVNVTVDGLVGSSPYLSFAGPVIYPNTLRRTGNAPGLATHTVQVDPTTAAPYSLTFDGKVRKTKTKTKQTRIRKLAEMLKPLSFSVSFSLELR